MKKRTIKKLFFKLHKYLGIISGVVIFIIAITGCIWVCKFFINEQETLIEVPIELNRQILLPSQVKQIAGKIIQDKTIHGVSYTPEPNHAIKIVFYEQTPLFYQSIYIHPYSGELLKLEDHTAGFFAFILEGHRFLWLPRKIGEPIVKYSTYVFLVLLLSGLYLWWPTSKKKKQRFYFNWKLSTRWKRKNFDLHSIGGMYTFVFSFLIGFTGLVLTSKNLASIYYKFIGGDKRANFEVPYTSSVPLDDEKFIKNMDLLYLKIKNEMPYIEYFEMHYPSDMTNSTIYVEVDSDSKMFYDMDYLFFDSTTLNLVPSNSVFGTYKEAKLPDKIIRMNYEIHIGSIAGVLGNLFVFLISLFIACLPITGFLIWYGRNRKKKRFFN